MNELTRRCPPTTTYATIVNWQWMGYLLATALNLCLTERTMKADKSSLKKWEFWYRIQTLYQLCQWPIYIVANLLNVVLFSRTDFRVTTTTTTK